MIARLAWKWFGSALLAEYLRDQNKPTSHSAMVYAFTDQKGRKYYRFPKDMALPLDRYGQMLKYLSYLSARLTPEQMDSIIDTALGIIQEGIGKDKNAAKVAALLYELRDRERLIVPAQLVYDIIAVQYVREDELPGVYDNDIHMDKVRTFIDDISKSDFFFRLPEFVQLTNSSTMSTDEWAKYLEATADQDAVLIKILRVIYSGKPLKSSGEVSRTS